jgi:hypothetical protein
MTVMRPSVQQRCDVVPQSVSDALHLVAEGGSQSQSMSDRVASGTAGRHVSTTRQTAVPAPVSSVPEPLRRLGVTLPICQAPIGSLASAELAAAVSEAGGLGHVACTWRTPDELRALFSQVRDMTTRSFGANFVTEHSQEQIERI